MAPAPSDLARPFSEWEPATQKASIDSALRAALRGGAEILKIYPRQDVGVVDKSDGSPLTQADSAAHQAISAELESQGIPILSEEGKKLEFETRKAWQLFWMVDPLDGTKEFIKKNGEFTVNIALIEEGIPRVGVVYVPVKKQLYLGLNFAQPRSYLLEECATESEIDLDRVLTQAQTLPRAASPRPFRVVGSRSHLSAETAAFVDQLRALHPDLEMVSMGSSLKLCMVAEGSADVYPRFAPTMEWDTAAGDAVARAAGKSVNIANEKGESLGPVQYNKEDLLNPWFIVEA